MADLVRTQPQQSNDRTRVIFVRQPIKDVRREHDRNMLPVRLAIGVIAALGAAAALWLIGFLGFHLGFAQAIGVPELVLPAGGGLIAGMRLLLTIPESVVRAAVAQPVWLMVGFLLVAIPAASLAVIGPPQTPGGPRPHILAVVFSHLGAVAACVLALALLAWVLSPVRNTHLGPMPVEVNQFDLWLRSLRIIAGLDALAIGAAAVWTVLIMRLMVPRWLKGLSATTIIVALGIVTVTGSMTLGTLAQMHAPRMVVGEEIVVGRVDGQCVVAMRAADGTVQLALTPVEQQVIIAQHRTMAEFLRLGVQ